MDPQHFQPDFSYPGFSVAEKLPEATSRQILIPSNEAMRAAFMGMTSIRPETPFKEAFSTWIESRVMVSPNQRYSSAKYISKKTETDYRQYARALGKMFDDTPIKEIRVGMLHEYQRARAFCDGTNLKVPVWAAQAGTNLIRKEVALLVRIMKSAGLWTEQFRVLYQPLQIEESDIERPLSPHEQRHFLAVAASRERWSLILHYSVAALQTSCSTNELRTLRLGDVSLEHGVITIRSEGAKNKFRQRTIPLESKEVVWAFERLLERARNLGATSPSDYLFPFRHSTLYYDPSRPMGVSALYKKWDEVRSAANVKWLRPYDLRHTAITRMAEAGVPIAIIMSFAGHVSLKMQQHYTTISMMAKRKAMGSVWSPTPSQPDGTQSDTAPFARRAEPKAPAPQPHSQPRLAIVSRSAPAPVQWSGHLAG